MNKDSYQCDHANEVPLFCSCNKNCFCRLDGSCRKNDSENLLLVKIIKVYADVDGIDDNGIRALGYFSTPILATQHHKNRYTNASTWERPRIKEMQAIVLSDGRIFVVHDKNIVIDPDHMFIKNQKEQRLKNQALAKLTYEEKKALGLKE